MIPAHLSDFEHEVNKANNGYVDNQGSGGGEVYSDHELQHDGVPTFQDTQGDSQLRATQEHQESGEVLSPVSNRGYSSHLTRTVSGFCTDYR